MSFGMYRNQDEYRFDAQRRMSENAIAQRDADTDRRHEARLIVIAQGLQSAISTNPELFGDGGDVALAAEAAVAVLERG
jgi:hypothetical protein